MRLGRVRALAVVGALTDGFMWVYEIVSDDRRSLHAYQHRYTRRYLHLDTECNLWVYQHRQGRTMYRRLADALIEPFADWEGLASGPTIEERATTTAQSAAVVTADITPRAPSGDLRL